MASAARYLRIAPGDGTVLVTGANGYIGSTVVDVLLEEGYNVRGTVRSAKPWLDKLFTDKFGPSRFDSVVVPDLGNQAEFEKALQGVSGVVHVVSISAAECSTMMYHNADADFLGARHRT